MSGFVRSESWNFEPCVYSRDPLAVAGVSCISPTAPALERAWALNLLSVSITAASSAGSSRCCCAYVRTIAGYCSGCQSRAYQAGSVCCR